MVVDKMKNKGFECEELFIVYFRDVKLLVMNEYIL